jgi:ABC-2 type transport system permease protein
MVLTALAAMVRKDLLVFISDRRAVIMAFIVPIAIASFFGSLFRDVGNADPAKIPVAIVDEDGSAVSKRIASGASGDTLLKVEAMGRDAARAGVRKGDITVAVVLPKGFGDDAGRAFFSGERKPELTMWYDPSHAAELGMVRGILTEHVMQAVSQEMFSGASGQRLIADTLGNLDRIGLQGGQREALRALLQSAQRFYNNASPQSGSAPGGFSMPYTNHEEAVTSGQNVAYNGYAHSFAGMGVQFLLFASIDLGLGILLERQRGLWKRLRSAPLSRLSLLLGKAISTAIIAFLTLIASFAFAMAVFKVRVSGSVAGFLAVCVATALMAATYGLLIAALGRTPGGTRGMAILATLMMVMLGGAWVPAFIFPRWLQQATLVIPTRWAVDGLDAMTWRGLGLREAVMPTAMLLGFTVLFGVLAVSRFRWEEA